VFRIGRISAGLPVFEEKVRPAAAAHVSMNKTVSHLPVYRAYILGADGDIIFGVVLNCATDEQAIAKAREYANGSAVEVWERERKVAVIPLETKRKG
jgi:hypothetical protein